METNKEIKLKHYSRYEQYFCREKEAHALFLLVRKRDREPSRVHVRKYVNLMNRNRQARREIERFIKHCIPKSYALHNLVSMHKSSQQNSRTKRLLLTISSDVF